MFARSVIRPFLLSRAACPKNHCPLTAAILKNTLPLRTYSSSDTDDDTAVKGARFTTRFHLHSPKELKTIPTFRLMDNSGKVLNKSLDPGFTKEELQKMYQTMFTLNTMDFILYEGQRQGRLSFYMTSYGEEASHIGSAAALEQSDLIYGQYRETGVMLWRGFTAEDCINQCLSNEKDKGKGRQMPVHYGSSDINFHTISSPLGTQLPQATGAAYAFKLKRQDNVVVCYFGEGAASEGDFHPALNFASTLDCPVLFICRNNGYAISTPAHEQYRGDGIASRAIGYGMEYLRVDGNDVFAMYVATKYAREHSVKNSRPVLIEAMTYRIGHHSTSDDSSRYRMTSEIDHWKSTNNPLKRLRLYMEERGWWTEAQEAQIQKETREHVQSALKKAELLKKPPLEDMFSDVYDTLPPNLVEQQQSLFEHIKLFPEHYDIQSHKN